MQRVDVSVERSRPPEVVRGSGEVEVHSPADQAAGAVGATTSPGLGGQVRRGALWSIANTLLVRVVSIAVMAVAVRLVTPHEFGVFAVAVIVHTIISSVGDIGVAVALTREDVDPDEYAPTVATISCLSGVVLGAGMAVFAGPLAHLLGSDDAAGVMRVLALAVVVVGVFAVPSAQLTRDFRQATMFRVNACASVVSNTALILLAALGYGALAFAWSRVALQLLTGLGMTICCRPRYRPGWSGVRARRLMAFGLPLAAANLLNYGWLNADYAIVGRMLGPDDLGIYMLAFNIAYLPTALLAPMLNTVAMPAFSRVGGDADRAEATLGRALEAVALVAFPISAMALALARPVVLVVYGERWERASMPLSVLALYAGGFTLSLLFANVLVGMGRTRLILAVQVAWSAFLVPSMAVGVALAGIDGVALAHVAVIVVLILPTYGFLLHRYARLSLRRTMRPLVLPASGAAAAALSAWAASHAFGRPIWQLLAGAVAGLSVYVALVHQSLHVLGLDGLARPVGKVLTRAGVRGRWRTADEAVAAPPPR